MNTILSTVLITAPLAFVAGWILAKAVFRSLDSGARDTDYRKLLQQQKKAITERDGQIAELHAQLEVTEKKMLRTKQIFGTWRDRIRPIARQFRQQRAIITELRDELRRRDNGQQAKPVAAQTKPAKAQAKPVAAPATPAKAPAKPATPQTQSAAPAKKPASEPVG